MARSPCITGARGDMKIVTAVVLGPLLSCSAHAASDTPLSASARASIVQTLAKDINANYVEPAVAKRVSNAIARKNAEGG